MKHNLYMVPVLALVWVLCSCQLTDDSTDDSTEGAIDSDSFQLSTVQYNEEILTSHPTIDSVSNDRVYLKDDAIDSKYSTKNSRYSTKMPNVYIGGLFPQTPFIELDVFTNHDDEIRFQFENEGYFHRYSGFVLSYTRYAYYDQNKWVTLKKPDDLKALVQPLTTKGAALGYALLATNYTVFENYEKVGGYVYHVDTIKDSDVQEIDAGFEVLLYDNNIQGGCGTSPTYAVTLLVEKTGTITEVSREKVFEYDGVICID